MWTQGSSGAYCDNHGTCKGSAYGFARQYSINADGSGTCFSHVHSTLGIGTGLEVNISYKGFFEPDNERHLRFVADGRDDDLRSSAVRLEAKTSAFISRCLLSRWR